MKKQPNALFEFTIVLMMIAAALVFVFNINLSTWNHKTSTTNQEKKADMSENPEMANWKQGKNLFKSNCAACHNLKSEGTGPALAGVRQRWNAAGSFKGKSGDDWLKIWVKNWNEPVAAEYKYAVEMANSRPAQMNAFPYLSDQDINLIFDYIDNPDGINPVAKQ